MAGVPNGGFWIPDGGWRIPDSRLARFPASGFGFRVSVTTKLAFDSGKRV